MIALGTLRAGQLGALAILLTAVAGTALVVAGFARTYSQHATEIAEREAAWGRFAAVASQADQVDRWIAGLGRAGEGTLLLPGASPSLAAAELQSRLTRAAGEVGAELTSFQPLDPLAGEGFTQIGVAIVLRGTLASFVSMLSAIENSTPLLIVEKARFRATEGRRPDEEREPLIDAELEVLGFMRASKDTAR